MKTTALALIVLLGGSALAQPAGPMLTRYAANQLGGVTTILRYTVARPDREETRYHFLTTPSPRALPEEVQVLDSGGEIVRLSDQQGADCTLARVEIVTGRSPAVISAVRVYAPDEDQSAPAPMDIQRYRPVPGGDVGQSRLLLRAIGAPVRTGPLCGLADVRRAMMRR